MPVFINLIRQSTLLIVSVSPPCGALVAVKSEGPDTVAFTSSMKFLNHDKKTFGSTTNLRLVDVLESLEYQNKTLDV